MSLDENAQSQLEQLARSMLTAQPQKSSLPFEKFGILVRKDSPEFEKRKGVIAFGEFEVDSIQFVYFAA